MEDVKKIVLEKIVDDTSKQLFTKIFEIYQKKGKEELTDLFSDIMDDFTLLNKLVSPDEETQN